MDPTDAIKAARAAVSEAGLDDKDPNSPIAFQEVLRHLLASGSRDARTPTVDRSAPLQREEPVEADPPSRVAAWAGVERSLLDDVATFGSEGVEIELHTTHLPAGKAARQRLLAILKLGVDRVAYDRAEVPAREINALCSRYDCLDQNLPGHLENYGNFIRRKGSRGSAVYRLTQFGLDEAREQLRTALRAA